MPTVQQIEQALTQVVDPELGRNIVELGMVPHVQIDGSDVAITLALTVMGCPLREYLKEATQTAAASVPGVENVTVELTAMTGAQRQAVMELVSGPSPTMGINHIGHVVAVMSGKGGVGKSSVAALLATALQRRGHAVGILDADITGPSIPRMFGISGPTQGLPLGIVPATTRMGIKVISTNLMLPEEDMAIVWRGPVMANAIKQFWKDVLWGRLDYLLVDLPPGTSDATLTAMQSLPLTGVLLVTMPQSLSSMIVRKAVHMAQELNVPILGVVENMSYFPCPDTATRHEIFGPSHTAAVAQAAAAPVLGRLPIDPDLARLADAGEIERYDHVAYAELAGAFIDTVPLTVAPPARVAVA
jgi:Mrp family chromosome partitioning ATPase